MKLGELRAREDLDEVLKETLRERLSERLGRAVEVSAPEGADENAWRLQPLVGVCWGPGLNDAGRHFIAAMLRGGNSWEARALRAPIRAVLRTAAGLKVTSRRAFGLPSHVVDSTQTLLLLGNRRIRLVFLGSGRCLVLLKAGFSSEGMKTEIQRRGRHLAGPFPKIDAHDEEGRWFEEDVLDAEPLPRCPSSWKPEDLGSLAVKRLEDWSEHTIVWRNATEYVEELRCRLLGGLERRVGKYDLRLLLKPEWLDALSQRATRLGTIETRVSHGDLQPGNILVERTSRVPLITDWETSDRRSVWYDRLVWALETRYGGDLMKRFNTFVTTGTSKRHPLVELRSRPQRQSVVALFLLEELEWLIRESTAGPLVCPGAGVFEYARELRKAGEGLGGIFA